MTYVTYTATGPFNNASAPGISAAFLDAVETFLGAGWFDSLITSDGSGNLSTNSLRASSFATLNGTTSGTITIYEPLQGAIKVAWVYFNGYENTTATEQKLALPVAFSGSHVSYVAFGPIPQLHLYAGGSALSGKCQVITSLPSGSGAGNFTAESTINGYQYGEITASFDSVGGGSSQSFTFTASLLFIGT